MNFWWGCEKVSTECQNCYIGPIMRRSGNEPFQGPMKTKDWAKPRRWNAQAQEAGIRSRVFTCSMSDFFHDGADQWRDEAWQVIRSCPHLDWLVLTKRPENIADRLPEDWGDGYPNVWLGVTVGCHSSLWRVEQLLDTPAAIKFVSAEPLLEQIDFSPHLAGIDWVITGCEQAAKGKRRLMELDWVRQIDRDCQEYRVSHYFKQYYRDNKGTPCVDGMLDGVHRQDFPDSPAATFNISPRRTK